MFRIIEWISEIRTEKISNEINGLLTLQLKRQNIYRNVLSEPYVVDKFCIELE